jgi:membrane associated rhomboid family serine protease
MGESDRYQDYQHYKKNRGNIFASQGDNALFWLLTLNVVVYLVLLFVQVGYDVSDHNNDLFNKQVLVNFQLPAQASAFGQKPWTFFIYYFSDVSFLRILSNTLWLWSFGSILQALTGNRKLFPLFIYGGLAGGLCFVVGGALFSHAATGAYLLGANTGVMAIAVATTMLQPNYRLFSHINGGIPLWTLFVAYFIIAVLGVSGGGAPYLFSILGAGLSGLLFVILLRKGTDASAWMVRFYYWVSNLFNPEKKSSSTIKEKVFYNTGSRTPYSRSANITQQRVDDILDKISRDGYASLTDEEKKILRRASEEEL